MKYLLAGLHVEIHVSQDEVKSRPIARAVLVECQCAGGRPVRRRTSRLNVPLGLVTTTQSQQSTGAYWTQNMLHGAVNKLTNNYYYTRLTASLPGQHG